MLLVTGIFIGAFIGTMTMSLLFISKDEKGNKHEIQKNEKET